MYSVRTLLIFLPSCWNRLMSLILILCLPSSICRYDSQVHHSYFNSLWQSADTLGSPFPIYDAHIGKLSDLTDLLKDTTFFGEWAAENGVGGFEFEKQRGFCTFKCHSSLNCLFFITLFDGSYKTGKSVFLLYSDKKKSDFNKTNSSVIYTDEQVNLALSDKTQGAPLSCKTTTSLYFINISNSQPFTAPEPSLEKQFFGVQFEVLSPQCNFSFITTVMVPEDSLFDDQVIPYVIIMGIFALIEAGVCLFLFKSYQKKEILAKRVSKGTLAIMNSFCCYLALFNAYWFLNHLSYYALISLIYGGMAFVIWPKLIWKVSVIHIKRSNLRRKAKAVVQAYFCISWMLTIVVIPLLTVTVNENIIYFVSALSFLPQIVHNYQHSRKYIWNFWLIGCIVVPKLFFIVYLFLLKIDPIIEPNTILAGLNLGSVLMQCLILLIQKKWPRLGNEIKLPYQFLLEKEVNSREEVCPVCLEDLKKSLTESLRKSILDEGNTSKYRKMILTPCKHKFHEACLIKWLKTKSDCPNCREKLPTIEDEECY